MSNIQAYKRRGIVSVVGSWKTEHASIAESLGRRIALEGLSLMTGGGQGVMKAAARGFCSVPRGERKGVSIGVLWSGVKVGEIPDYPNEFIEVPISMKVKIKKIGEHDLHSRNHGNEADVVIALEGDSMTATEIEQAVGYEHPTIVASFWTGRFPELWDFENVDDAMTYVKAIIRDKAARPDVHAKKVANVNRGKAAAMVREEESRRCIEKGLDNEQWMKEEEERQQREKEGMDGDEGREAGVDKGRKV